MSEDGSVTTIIDIHSVTGNVTSITESPIPQSRPIDSPDQMTIEYKDIRPGRTIPDVEQSLIRMKEDEGIWMQGMTDGLELSNFVYGEESEKAINIANSYVKAEKRLIEMRPPNILRRQSLGAFDVLNDPKQRGAVLKNTRLTDKSFKNWCSISNLQINEESRKMFDENRHKLFLAREYAKRNKTTSIPKEFEKDHKKKRSYEDGFKRAWDILAPEKDNTYWDKYWYLD